MKGKALLIFLLSLCSSVFLFIFISFAFYSRAATDEYLLIYNVQQFGVYELVRACYMQWTGRWTAMFLLAILYLLNNYFLVSLLGGLTFLFSLFTLLIISVHRFQVQLKWYIVLLFTLCITGLIFWATPGKQGETWVWAQTSYLWSISTTILAFAMVMHRKKISLPILLLCMIYIGGASESFAVTILVGMSLILVYAYGFTSYRWYKNQNSSKTILFDPKAQNAFFRTKILLAWMFLSVSFLVTYLAPGNAVRASCLPSPDLLTGLFVTTKGILRFAIKYFIPNIHYYFICLVIFLYAGQLSNIKKEGDIPLRDFLLSCSLLLFFIFISFFLASYILSEYPPDRAMFQGSVFIFVFFAIWGFKIGQHGYLSEKQGIIGLNVALSVLISMLLFVFTFEMETEKKYSNALDERILTVQELKRMGNKNLVSLPPLPDSGIIYSAELTEDPQHFSNQYFKKGLELPFSVVVFEKK